MSPRRVLKGLVLAGGFSRRFGREKGEVRLQPEGLAAVEVLARRLESVCSEVWVSLRAGQTSPAVESAGLPVLRDPPDEHGPLGGLRAAFRCDPEASWLIVACDLFSLDEATLRNLAAARHPAAAVVAVRNPETNRPEPLCAIYEPACALALEQVRTARGFCLQSFLAALPLAWISPSRPDAVRNYNQRESLPEGLVVGFD